MTYRTYSGDGKQFGAPVGSENLSATLSVLVEYHLDKAPFTVESPDLEVRVERREDDDTKSAITLVSGWPSREEFMALGDHAAFLSDQYDVERRNPSRSIALNPLVRYRGRYIAIREVAEVDKIVDDAVEYALRQVGQDQTSKVDVPARFLVVDGDDNELFDTSDAVAAVNRMNELAFLDSTRSLSVWDRTTDTVWEHLRLGRYLDPQEHPATTIHETMVKALPSPMWPRGMYGCPQDMYGRDQIRGFLIKVSRDLGVE